VGFLYATELAACPHFKRGSTRGSLHRIDLWEARVNLLASRDTAIAFGMADAEGQNVRIRLDSATQQC